MDGNGRWAEKHAFGRITGHKRGAKSVKVVVTACREIGIKYSPCMHFLWKIGFVPGKRSMH
jgi:undecaprenyl diphosphate synthase